MIACDRDAGCFITGLHLALVLDLGHVLSLPAGGNVESGAKGCILLKPVLIVAFEPVDRTVAETEESNSPIDFIIVFQTADFIIFGQAFFQFGQQFVIGLVANAEHPQSVIFQFPAETGKVCGKIGRDKHKVFQSIHSISV